MTDTTMEWVTSSGGPLLLLDEGHLHEWEGANIPSRGRIVEARFRWNPDGPATDYDRACDVDDYVGLIDVGNGQATVLGDEHFETTWLALPDGGILVRWVYAENEASLIAASKRIPSGAYKDTGLSFTVGESPLMLFAASDAGEEVIHPRLKIHLPEGRYRILTSEYADGSETSIICHRLQKIEGAVL